MKVEANVFSSGTNDETSFVFIIGQLAVVVNILLQSLLRERNLYAKTFWRRNYFFNFSTSCI